MKSHGSFLDVMGNHTNTVCEMTLVMASNKEKVLSLVMKNCFSWVLFLLEMEVHSPHRTWLVLHEQKAPIVGAEARSWFKGVFAPFTPV